MYFNYMSYLYYYYYGIDINKFYKFKNRQETQQDVPIHRAILDLKSGKLIKIILKAYNDKYVVAINGGGGLVMANQDSITPESTLLLVPQGLDRERVVIRTSGGYFICISGVGENFLSARNTFVDQNSQFEIVPIYPDKLALKTKQGYYASLVDNTMIKADSLSITPEGIFTIVEIQEGI